MSLEREIKEAFGELAAEVRTDAPVLDQAVGRARSRERNRRIAFGSLAVAVLAATIVVVPRLVGDRQSKIILAPDPSFSPSGAPGRGLNVELSLPSGAATAEIVEASIQIGDDAGGVSHIAVLWGETPGQFATITPACPPPTGPAPSTMETRVLRHAYRTPGTYSIRVQVITGHCQETAAETVEVQGKISVVQGATPSNGPLAPTVHIEDRRHLYENRPPLEANFYLAGGDEDGYVQRVLVDWGDGKSQTLVDAPLSECEEPPGQWPSTYLVGQEVKHVYTPGTYTLTVTVTSVACDGLEAQTQSGVFELESPS
jgi:hypothetical protein